MLKKDCYLLGNVAKTRGFKGELVLFLDVTNPLEYEHLESVFVEINGMLTPFFIEQIKLQGNNRAHVFFEQVDSEAEAQKLTGKALYLPLSTLPELEGNEFYDHEIPGFEVIDQAHGAVGLVVQVIDLANNPLLQIDNKGIEILVPMRNGTVLQVDRTNKQLHIQAPPGLIELYLSGDKSED
jgi:16S rRNA processing protein RimM